MKNLYPNLYLKKVEDITIEQLMKNKIKLLILDVDNTLIDYYKNLSEDVINWVRDMRGQGIKIGSKCMWDTTCDAAVSASWENEFTYAFCVAYGVYFY